MESSRHAVAGGELQVVPVHDSLVGGVGTADTAPSLPVAPGPASSGTVAAEVETVSGPDEHARRDAAAPQAIIGATKRRRKSTEKPFIPGYST